MLTRLSDLLRRCRIVVSLLVLTTLLVAGCAGPQEEGAEPTPSSFVGKAEPSRQAFVAIVVSGAREDGGERKVKAYLCDGVSTREWFEGSTTGNELDLTSEDGAKLQAAYSQKAVAGTIILNDGTSFTFEASPAAGGSGLYTVSIGLDGGFAGISETGGSIKGTIAEEPEEGKHATVATVTTPEGERLDFEAASRYRAPGRARLIVSDAYLVGAGIRPDPEDDHFFSIVGHLK